MSTVLRVEHLYKKYQLGVISHGTLYKDMQSWWARVQHKEDPNLRITESQVPGRDGERFWALQDINFEVPQGQALGIIGRNGAGKSTLLKVLSRVTIPTKGRALVKGRIASLLEVGTGFHPELTGRENIFLNGAILGMTKAEIRRKLDEIIAFSGVEKFIDTPVKRYSSGMYVRLAFAVAAHLEPEILVVDEVLAVGDAQFQERCLGKMKNIAGQGRTVLFVSHNMSAIRTLCPRALYLDSGRVVMDGSAETVVSKYLDRNLATGAEVRREEIDERLEGAIRRNNPFIRFSRLVLHDTEGQPRKSYNSDEDIILTVEFECLESVKNLFLLAVVEDAMNNELMSVTAGDDAETARQVSDVQPGHYRISCVFPKNTFGTNVFYLSIHLIYPKTEHLILKKILEFDVKFQGYNNIFVLEGPCHFRPALQWRMERLESGASESKSQSGTAIREGSS